MTDRAIEARGGSISGDLRAPGRVHHPQRETLSRDRAAAGPPRAGERVSRRGGPRRGGLRRDRRHQSRARRRAASHSTGRTHRLDRAALRRDRHRQGAGRARDPRCEPAGRPPDHQGELRRPLTGPGGQRAVRARARGVHRRHPAPHRTVRAGRPGDAVPRRGGGAAAGDPGEAAASAAGAGVRAGGRRADAAGGCAADRGDPPRSRRGGRGGALPRRPLLPPQRVSDPASRRCGSGRRTSGRWRSTSSRTSAAGWGSR